jgi:hypothetical protein
MGLLSDDEVARLVRVHRYRGLHAPCGHAVSVAPVLLALAASRSWIGREANLAHRPRPALRVITSPEARTIAPPWLTNG